MTAFTYHAPGLDTHTLVVVGPLAEAARLEGATGTVVFVEQVLDTVWADAVAAFARGVCPGPTTTIVLSGGESLKSLQSVASLWTACAAAGLDRSGVVIGVGGGALLDAVGFAAATWLRGVRFCAVPTTMLAQVDAALGGKSAINLDDAKNQVGLIRQPAIVHADPAFLATLPEAAFRSGLGEVAKTALLAGGDLWRLVVDEARSLLERRAPIMARVVEGCLRHKADVVSRDPFDRGWRATLNAGHSAGHAIETVSRRRGAPVEHGVAVAAGLRLEAQAVDGADRESVARVLSALGMSAPTVPSLTATEWMDALATDKKRRRDVLRLPVVRAPGSVEFCDTPLADLARAFARA